MTQYLKAYCPPLKQVVSIPQLKTLLCEGNPLFKHLRFYCPESCCQASLLYAFPLNHFFLSKGAAHARECPYFWTQSPGGEIKP